ncbi:MAG: hypothetical protein ACK47B_23870 [Armatimonadota bacterium]
MILINFTARRRLVPLALKHGARGEPWMLELTWLGVQVITANRPVAEWAIERLGKREGT